MTTVAPQPNVSLVSALKAAGLAGLIAAVINFLVYYAARLIIGGPLVVDPPGPPPESPLPVVVVIVASIVPALGAGLVYWGLDRFLPNPNRVFLIVSAVVFIAFMFNPITAAATSAVGWTLEIMHGVVAVPVVMTLLNLKK